MVARSGWSNGFLDFDNDGWKDLFTANSHVNDAIDQFESSAYRLTNSLFQGTGDGTFRDASAEAGLGSGPARAHRGAAFGDFDDDGRVDVVVTALQEPAELWRNDFAGGRPLAASPARGHEEQPGRHRRGGDDHRRRGPALAPTGQPHDHRRGLRVLDLRPRCISARERRKTIDRVEVRWPSGAVQVLADVRADQVTQSP